MITAKKSLGQHFLNSPSALGKIIDAAKIKAGETVLEIGPGTGILTKALLEKGARVIAVEKDARAIELLSDKFVEESSAGMFSLVEEDVLDYIPPKSYSIVANIPYYITGAILQKFLEKEPRPGRMVLLVQKEVAERIVAGRDGPGGRSKSGGTGKESILSISVKAFGAPKIIARVPRGAFSPPPSVDSAILSIENISDLKFKISGISPRDFFGLIHAGFAHKRKFLRRNLEKKIGKKTLEKTWSRLGLDPNARAEDISLETWFEIGADYPQKAEK
jgi:16S rRNA (adenine1518-N6/adenine1519-N6)-dimethyltransferase